MKTQRLFLLTLLILPGFAHAQGLQGFFTNLINFTNKTLIPFLFGLAFLFFVINTVRFFIFNGSNDEGRENAKNLALYGVFAFIVMIVFWAVVNMIASSIGLEGQKAPTPDYVQMNTKTTP